MPVVTHLIKTRAQLARLFTGQGVELGVAAGKFSAQILAAGQCERLWSIDRWNDHHDAKEYVRAARELVMQGRGRCIPLRMTFAEALPFFADGSLGFVYVDGYAHTGQDGGRTLEDWWPKLKPGGVFAGHDYHPRWQPTKDAVDAFAARHGLTLSFTQEAPPDGWPSWFTFKSQQP